MQACFVLSPPSYLHDDWERVGRVEGADNEIYHTPYHVSRVSRLCHHSCKYRRRSQTPDCRHRSWDHQLKTTGTGDSRLTHHEKIHSNRNQIITLMCIYPTANDNYSQSSSKFGHMLSVLKIGFALAQEVWQGEVNGCHPPGDSTWRLLQLAIEKAWSAQGSCTNGCRKRSFTV